MKISTKKLKQIIKEELENSFNEAVLPAKWYDKMKAQGEDMSGHTRKEESPAAAKKAQSTAKAKPPGNKRILRAAFYDKLKAKGEDMSGFIRQADRLDHSKPKPAASTPEEIAAQIAKGNHFDDASGKPITPKGREACAKNPECKKKWLSGAKDTAPEAKPAQQQKTSPQSKKIEKALDQTIAVEKEKLKKIKNNPDKTKKLAAMRKLIALDQEEDDLDDMEILKRMQQIKKEMK
jgi:hypothetical protein